LKFSLAEIPKIVSLFWFWISLRWNNNWWISSLWYWYISWW